MHPWITLFSAVAPAWRPSRLAIAFVTLLLIVGVGRLWDGFATAPAFSPLSQGVREGWLGAASAVISCDASAAAAEIRNTFWSAPSASWDRARWFTIFFVLAAAAIYSVGAGLLARLMAGEIAGKQWKVADAREFLSSRKVSLVTAPWLGCLVGVLVTGVLAAVGVLFHIPLFNAIAGALGGLWIALAMLAVVAWGCIAAGYPLFAPAVACDGCDAIESVQRAGAYILARPFLFVWLVLVGLTIAALATALADAVAIAAWNVAIGSLSASFSPGAFEAAGKMKWLAPSTPVLVSAEGWTDGLAMNLLDMWRTVLRLGVGAAVLSLTVSLATRIYLVLRRSCDGQDLGDLWEDAQKEGR